MVHIPDMQNLPTKKVKNSILPQGERGEEKCQAQNPLPISLYFPWNLSKERWNQVIFPIW